MIIIIGKNNHIFKDEIEAFSVFKGEAINRVPESYPILEKLDGCVTTIINNTSANDTIEFSRSWSNRLGNDTAIIDFSDFLGAVDDIGNTQDRVRESDFIRNTSSNLYCRLVKPFLDFAITLLSIPLLLPLLVIISIAIKIDDGGPVIFKQFRVGKNGKKFAFYKFRTMHVDADKRLEHLLNNNEEVKTEWERNFKLKNDPRITRIGNFLRKTSLDEIPQLLNILKGDLSLIGPRALPEYHLREFSTLFIDIRNSVKPGVTGLWQVSGRSENGDIDDFFTYDLTYIKDCNFINDLKILLKTFSVVATGYGAH